MPFARVSTAYIENLAKDVLKIIKELEKQQEKVSWKVIAAKLNIPYHTLVFHRKYFSREQSRKIDNAFYSLRKKHGDIHEKRRLDNDKPKQF